MKRWVWLSVAAVFLCGLGVGEAAVGSTRRANFWYFRKFQAETEPIGRGAGYYAVFKVVHVSTTLFIAKPPEDVIKELGRNVGDEKVILQADGASAEFDKEGGGVWLFGAMLRGVKGTLVNIHEYPAVPSSLDTFLIQKNFGWLHFRYGTFEKGFEIKKSMVFSAIALSRERPKMVRGFERWE